MKIKFSHQYHKLHEQRTALLMRVERTTIRQLPAQMLAYDTAFSRPDGTTDHYDLSTCRDVLVLTFLGDENIPFTTIRPWRFEKEDYYRGAIGRIFEIVVQPVDTTAENDEGVGRGQHRPD